MFISFHQKADQNHNIKTLDGCFETMKKFKYFGTKVTYQNCIHEEICKRLNLENAC